MLKDQMKRLLTETPGSVSRISAYLLVRTGITQDYQPLSAKSRGMRASAERLDAIKKNISADGNLCLDLGCNTGYFSYEIAKMGIFTIGFESEMKNIIVAEAQYSSPNLIFKRFTLDLNTARTLPQAGIILFLSVFHHLVKYGGREAAIAVFQALVEKCRSQFFFETGQPDERGIKWSGLMEFMGNTDEWVKEFFIKQCGFRAVRCLGAFETSVSPVRRKLFLAER